MPIEPEEEHLTREQALQLRTLLREADELVRPEEHLTREQALQLRTLLREADELVGRLEAMLSQIPGAPVGMALAAAAKSAGVPRLAAWAEAAAPMLRLPPE